MYKKEGISEEMYCIRNDDGLMLKIAHNYMKLMGIENTQFIIARHTDRDHPHCHIVYRNEKVCKMLTAPITACILPKEKSMSILCGYTFTTK